MHRVIERSGFIEVLFRDEVLATGGYRLVLEHRPSVCAGAEDVWMPVRARGTIRLHRGHSVQQAMRASTTLLVRLDRGATLPVTVHLYVRDAGLVAFTCDDPSALVLLGEESRRLDILGDDG